MKPNLISGTLPPLLTVNSRGWLLKQVEKLEDNRELDQDQALKHEDSRELIYKSIYLIYLSFNINNLHD